MTDDFSQYMDKTARALLGEPKSKKSKDWRYGNHGSLSINLDDGTWYDFESCEGGGVLDLVMRETEAATTKAAIRWLEAQSIKPEEQPTQSKQKARVVETYDYIDEQGEVLFQACRMEPKSFRQRKPDGKGGWSWSVKGVRQVPYRLQDIRDNPTATVLIVEGEKDADKLAELGLVATCNAGGAGKWPDQLNEHFKDRRVVIVPDNDKPGKDHAQQVAAKLYNEAASVRILDLPGLPDKGDVSDWLDQGGTRRQLIDACKRAPIWEPPKEPEPEPEQETPSVPDAPFRSLGYDDGYYYYLPKSTQQVTAIAAGQHTNKSYLLSIAPLEWWESRYAGNSGPDWVAAANDCMRLCEQCGSFDPTRVRGRGAWYDDGHSVLHLGDRLQVDGQSVGLTEHSTSYVYEHKPAMEALKADRDSLTADEASALLDITHRLSWQEPVNATLLAGWMALAPICGAMPWRPHIWITGQRGTGKSWVIDNIIAPALGPSAVAVQSNSTEAGIRQKLGIDARPILFDEAEGESSGGRNRMQQVLELARQASSEGVAEIAKGTAGGKALTFRIRSMFLMGSINVGLAQASDKSRFTVLTLAKPKQGKEGTEQFSDLESLVGNTLTPDWCARLRSRTYALIPQIRTNADTLARVAGEHIGNRRAGDQIGTLLAGAHALRSDEVITEDEARDWVASQDWESVDDEVESDEMMLAAELMHTQLQVEINGSRFLRSIAQLVQIVTGDDYDDHISPDSAHSALVAHGVKVMRDNGRGHNLAVSESHKEVKRILRDTSWAGGWGRILSRLPGGSRSPSIRFSGLRHRAAIVPLASIMEDDRPVQYQQDTLDPYDDVPF